MTSNRRLLVSLQMVALAGLVVEAGCQKKMMMRGAGIDSDYIIDGSAQSGDAHAAATPPAAAGEFQTTNTLGRSMIYTAALRVTVAGVAGAIESVRKIAEELGGHLQSMRQSSIVIRIPAAKFSAAIERIGGIGEIVDRDIHGSDVTDKLVDLDIRLDNLREMRERLVALMDKGGKVEELLAIEKELQRVTESIELYEGKLQHLRDSVALSTITVEFNSPVPQERIAEVVPFPWVRNLGQEVRPAGASVFSPEAHSGSWLRFELPKGFVRVRTLKGYTRAMSGDGVYVLVKREPNFEEATGDFWLQVVKRWLSAGKTIAIASDTQLTLSSGPKAALLEGVQDVGPDRYSYMLALVTTRKYVYTLEAWGRESAMAPHREGLRKTVQSMDVR